MGQVLAALVWVQLNWLEVSGAELKVEVAATS
jgi:hypothetical protein